MGIIELDQEPERTGNSEQALVGRVVGQAAYIAESGRPDQLLATAKRRRQEAVKAGCYNLPLELHSCILCVNAFSINFILSSSDAGYSSPKAHKISSKE